MNKRITFVLISLMSFGLLSCQNNIGTYIGDTFFSKDTLKEYAIADLPTPEEGQFLLIKGDNETVYINSKQSASEYFLDILDYAMHIDYFDFGTVEGIKSNGNDVHPTQYYFHSMRAYSSIIPNNYYFKEESSYIFTYTLEGYQEKNGEQVLINPYLIKLCDKEGSIKYQDNDDNTHFFYYDYYLSLENNIEVWNKEKMPEIYLKDIMFRYVDIASIKKIRVENGYIGVAPGSFTNIMYSSNENDIKNLYNALLRPLRLISEENALVTGGSYYQYTFYDELNKKYELCVDNKIIYYGGAYYYLDFTFFYDIYKLSSCLHSFITYSDTCAIYDNDNNIVCDYKGLSNFEFRPSDAVNKEARYHLGEEFDMDIYIIDADTFYIEENEKKSFYKIETSQDHSNFAFLFQN